jgi:hypothetical protein
MDDLIGAAEEAKARAILESGTTDDPGDDAEDSGDNTEEPEAEEVDSEEAEGGVEAETENKESSDGDQPTYEVKVDGKKVKVPLSELVSGYQRQADYTQKTQALAEERKRFETENATLKRLADVIEKNPKILNFIKQQLFEERYGTRYTPQAEEQVRQSKEMTQYKSEAMLSRFTTQHPELDDNTLLQVVQTAGQLAAKDPDSLPVAMEVAYRALQAQTVSERLAAIEAENKELKKRQKADFIGQRSTPAPTVQGKGGSAPRSKGKPVTLDGDDGSITAREAALRLLTTMQEE